MSIGRLPKKLQKGKPAKLDRYIGTLKLLASTGPIEINQAQELSIDDRKPVEFASDVEFLEKQQMIQKTEQKNHVFCYLTERGKRMLIYFETLPSPFCLEDIEDIEENSEDYEEEEDGDEYEEESDDKLEDDKSNQ